MQKNNNRAMITLGIICFLLCFMMTLQIRTIKQSDADILKLKNENELRDEINQWKDQYDNANDKITELNNKITEYQNASSQRSETVALLKQELDDLSILAGLTSVKGQGITITLDDTAAKEKIMLDAGFFDPNVYVIHDSDILLVINELRAAGAEAISVNGQRVVANSEIRCVGPVISINNIRLTAPFTISAIGDSTVLANSLKLRGGVIDSIQEADIDVIVEKKEEIIVPKLEKVIEYKYSLPVEEGVA
ncbi:MAG: DUF881 domain-containing protein [Clostridia bacterium]|nr:DUF881 domain-containing protein [Clostridia bacterium]